MSETVLVATDGGLVRLGDDAVPPLEEPITHLARADEAVWAVTGSSALWRAAGDRWERVVETGGLLARCLLPQGSGALVGTSEARLYRAGEDGLERVASFDRIEGRARWFTPWGGPPDVRSLSAGDGHLYANVHVGGIVRSEDRGLTWAPTPLDIETDVHQVLAHPRAPGAVLAATAYGLATSPDAGRTWEIHDAGLEDTYCRAVAATEEGALVSASGGHTGQRAGLYRFREGRFERCEDGLPRWFADNLDTHRLDARPGLAAAGTSDGDVFVSRDAGLSWERVAEGLGPVRSVLVLA